MPTITLNGKTIPKETGTVKAGLDSGIARRMAAGTAI